MFRVRSTNPISRNVCTHFLNTLVIKQHSLVKNVWTVDRDTSLFPLVLIALFLRSLQELKRCCCRPRAAKKRSNISILQFQLGCSQGDVSRTSSPSMFLTLGRTTVCDILLRECWEYSLPSFHQFISLFFPPLFLNLLSLSSCCWCIFVFPIHTIFCWQDMICDEVMKRFCQNKVCENSNFPDVCINVNAHLLV